MDAGPRCCLACRTPLAVKRHTSGKTETPAQLAKRKYCDRQCQALHNKPKQPPSHPWVQAGALVSKRRSRRAAEAIAAMRRKA